MSWIKKTSSIFFLIGLAFSIVGCSNNKAIGMGEFLQCIENLEIPPYKYSYINGKFNYSLIEAYPEKLESNKISKTENINGKFEIINRYDTKACEESSQVYNDYLTNARDFLSHESNMNGINGTSDLNNFFVKKNRKIEKDPLSIKYSFNGYTNGIYHWNNGIDSPSGYYKINGVYAFDNYGCPTTISISFHYVSYQRIIDGEENVYQKGRIRYSKQIFYTIDIKIHWENE